MNNKSENKKNIADKLLSNRIYPIILLSIIVLISVSLIMAISNVTKAKIAAERDAKVLGQLEEIFTDMDDFKFNGDYYQIFEGGQLLGYAFAATGKGYAGDINILVGIDAEFLVKDIRVITNTETPGLGTKITESFFTDQFKGLAAGELGLVSEGGKIDAITSATISSKAVVDAVKSELEAKIEQIKGGK